MVFCCIADWQSADRSVVRSACRLPIRDTADYQSALRRIGTSGRRLGPMAVLNFGLFSLGICFGFRASDLRSQTVGPCWVTSAQLIDRTDAQSAEVGVPEKLLRVVRVFRGLMVGRSYGGGLGRLPKLTGQQPVLPMLWQPLRGCGAPAHSKLSLALGRQGRILSPKPTPHLTHRSLLPVVAERVWPRPLFARRRSPLHLRRRGQAEGRLLWGAELGLHSATRRPSRPARLRRRSKA